MPCFIFGTLEKQEVTASISPDRSETGLLIMKNSFRISLRHFTVMYPAVLYTTHSTFPAVVGGSNMFYSENDTPVSNVIFISNV